VGLVKTDNSKGNCNGKAGGGGFYIPAHLRQAALQSSKKGTTS